MSELNNKGTISSIAILANPLAGKGNSLKWSNWLKNELSQKQIHFIYFQNNWPENFNSFSDIWILGGDGSINYFINHFPDCKKPITVFKTGTGNDFAWKLYGSATNPAIFDIALLANPQPVDAGKCNETLFINSFGIGFDGEILKMMKSIRLLGGSLGYLLAILLKIIQFQEKNIKIKLEKENWQERFLLVIVNNSSRAGGGFMITPEAEINDGELDLFLCRELTIFKRLLYLPLLKAGKHKHLPFVINRRLKRIEIEAENEIAIQLDGELYFSKSLEIKVLPNQFYFRYI